MGWNGKKLLKPTPEALESFSPAPFVFKHKVACHLKKNCVGGRSRGCGSSSEL